MDMSAGIEHLTRGTSRGVDMLIIVTEPTRVSVQTTRVVQRLAAELSIKQVKSFSQQGEDREGREFVSSQFTEAELLALLPFDEGCWKML